MTTEPTEPAQPEAAEVVAPELDADYHYIDCFRVIRAAGKSDAEKARAMAQYVANECAALIQEQRPSAAQERKAVVAYLNNYDPQLADAIERGDHLASSPEV